MLKAHRDELVTTCHPELSSTRLRVLLLPSPSLLCRNSGLKYQGLLSGIFSYYTGGAVAQNSARCDAKGVTGNMEGEGLKLGGVFAVAPTGDVIPAGHTAQLLAPLASP